MGKEVVIDDTKKRPEDAPSNVHVELDENNQPVKQEKSPEPKYVRLEDLEKINQAINNTREWNTRKVTNLEQKIDQLLRQQTPPAKQEPQRPPDEWEAKLQKDWKGTVQELADQRYEENRKREREMERIQAEQYRSAQLLEENKKKVLEKHKDLIDETSPKADIYKQVLQEHPEYLSNPFGPVLAMRDMEDRLKENGVLDEPTRNVINKEVARQARTSATSLPKSSAPSTGGKTITLTKDQKEFCDANGLKYQDYAKYAAMINSKGGVEA